MQSWRVGVRKSCLYNNLMLPSLLLSTHFIQTFRTTPGGGETDNDVKKIMEINTLRLMKFLFDIKEYSFELILFVSKDLGTTLAYLLSNT